MIPCAAASDFSALSNFEKQGLQQYCTTYAICHQGDRVQASSRSRFTFIAQLLLQDSEGVADCTTVQPPHRQYNKEYSFSVRLSSLHSWHANAFQLLTLSGSQDTPLRQEFDVTLPDTREDVGVWARDYVSYRIVWVG